MACVSQVNMSLPGVLIIGNLLSGSGASRAVCEDLAERLRGRGYRVTAASTRVNRALRFGDMFATTWRGRSNFDVALIDVFSGAAFAWAESVCWMLRKLHKPFILTLHGGNLPLLAARSPRRVRRLLDSAWRVTAPSRYLAEGLRESCDDIMQLPNPVDCARYPFRLRERPAPRLVWLRAYHPIYNPLLAPRVLKLLCETHPDCRLTMVGFDREPGTMAATEAEARRLGVADRCDFRGPVPKTEVPTALQAGDIFLNTTNVDNTPVSVIEAMACGLCVVSTNVGGLRHLLNDGENALLTEPDDADGMAAAVRKLLSDHELAARLSRQGRAFAEECDWSAVLPKWEALIQQCAEEAMA